LFAYNGPMEIAGYRRETDLSKMGPTLVIASSLILAIRTAKWPRIACDTASQPEWDAEVEQSVKMAHRILSHLLAKSPFLFPHKDVPWRQPGEDESPK
jgi:hypothetical protein